MVSEFPSSITTKVNVVVAKPIDRSSPDRKSQVKVPKKIHKAEREKLKRDHLNELFLELGHALEPSRQNSGKASILGDATKLLRDLIVQVESLRRENVTLLKESNYVTLEKNELKDETTALEAEIEKLQIEIRERMQSNPSWNYATDATHLLQTASSTLSTHQNSPVAPVYVIPLPQDVQPYSDGSPELLSALKLPSHVRRPHARYPTPSDSWPHQILSQQAITVNYNGGSSTSTTSSHSNSRDAVGSSPKELRLLD